MILSSSRDKTVIIWQLTGEGDNYGFARRALKGHSHFVEDVVISSDGQFALSGSWDGTLRLWDLNTGNTTAALSDTPRMFSPSRFRRTTGRLSQPRAIRASSCGTPSASASLRSTKMVTPSGSPASGSPPLPPSPHRLVRLGQARQGLEPQHVQALHEPHWPHRIPEHRHRLARRLALRFWW